MNATSYRKPERGHSLGHLLTMLVLLWLAGNGLRLTILAVPPVIPLIHRDLHLSETEVGILTGLPSILFACAAVPGSLLIARLGALKTLVAGLLITAIGSALRGAAFDVGTLYAATIMTGFGVAVMHPSLPTIVRQWLQDRIGFGTAVFINGLLIGEILPVALTLSLVLPLVPYAIVPLSAADTDIQPVKPVATCSVWGTVAPVNSNFFRSNGRERSTP